MATKTMFRTIQPHDTAQYDAVSAMVRVSDRDPLHRIALNRALYALTDLIHQMDEASLERATSKPNHFEFLFEVLQSSLTVSEAKENAVYQALLRGVRAKQQLLEMNGGCVGPGELGEVLGITRQAVDKQRRKGKLVAVQTSARGWLYPLWQVRDGRKIRGLEEVLDVLHGQEPWMVFQFFLVPSPRLSDGLSEHWECSPLDVLSALHDDLESDALARVLDDAHTYLEHGAD